MSPCKRAHYALEPRTGTGAALRAPSPRGEGWGEGDRDVRSPGRLLGKDAPSRKVHGEGLRGVRQLLLPRSKTSVSYREIHQFLRMEEALEVVMALAFKNDQLHQ